MTSVGLALHGARRHDRAVQSLPRSSVLLAGALAALVLGGCTGSGSEDSGERGEATDPVDARCTDSPEVEDGLTRPGQVLCLGAKATVPVTDGASSAVVDLTVTAVAKLPDAERAKFDESEFFAATYPLDEYDVHLVRYTVKVVSEEEKGQFSGSRPVFDVAWSNVQPWAEDVDTPVGLGPSGCARADHSRGQAPTAEVEGCEWAFVRKGEVHGARYWNATAGYDPRSGGDFLYWK